jgi:hypothetical protein
MHRSMQECASPGGKGASSGFPGRDHVIQKECGGICLTSSGSSQNSPTSPSPPLDIDMSHEPLRTTSGAVCLSSRNDDFFCLLAQSFMCQMSETSRTCRVRKNLERSSPSCHRHHDLSIQRQLDGWSEVDGWSDVDGWSEIDGWAKVDGWLFEGFGLPKIRSTVNF